MPDSDACQNMSTLNRNRYATLPGKIAALLRESKWFALLAWRSTCCWFWLLSTRPIRAGLTAPQRLTSRNAGGRVGAWLSELLLYLFGVSAYWWVALLATSSSPGAIAGWTAAACWTSARCCWRWPVLPCCSLAACAIGSAAAVTRLKAALPLAPGGMLGAVVSGQLVRGVQVLPGRR